MARFLGTVVRCRASLALLLWLGGCAGPAVTPGQESVHTLYSGNRCGAAEAFRVRWLDGTDAVNRALEGLGGRVLLSEFGASRAAAQVDSEAGLLVEMGRQPSAGYALSLVSDVMTVRGGTATVVLRIQRPTEGSMQAAVLTSPCLLLGLPRGDYNEVRVTDAGGVLLASVPVGP